MSTVENGPLTHVSEFRLKLYPKNFDASREFYASFLEFPIIKEWNDGVHDRGVMFDTGAGIIELLSYKGTYIPIRGADVSLRVSDVWVLWNTLKTRATVHFPLRDNAWGDTSFAISDPDGFCITFFTKNTNI